MENREKIKKYWDERAAENQNVVIATTDDIYLRELEISTLSKTIDALNFTDNSLIVDIGCGDGYSTLCVATLLPGPIFQGIDYSPNMIANANARLSHLPDMSNRVKFSAGDVMDLQTSLANMQYQCAITDRCLINLDSHESQVQAVEQISKHVMPGGYYIAIENFIEGHQNMNDARQKMGLTEIPVRWHNLFFTEREFIDAVKPFFEVQEIKDFASSYYFATRVIYSKMCMMNNEKPDYAHDIHKLAVDLPSFGQFSPIRMAVLKRK
jgi:SAM-dependent methyltransferase